MSGEPRESVLEQHLRVRGHVRGAAARTGSCPAGQAASRLDAPRCDPSPEEAAKRLHILQHSLGVDEFGRGKMYRTRFVTGPGSLDYDTCMALVADGLMTRRDASTLPFGGNDLFFVTEAGKCHVREHSPKPPKLTRGQKRYRDFLNFDGSMTFIEYCRWSDRIEAEVPF